MQFDGASFVFDYFKRLHGLALLLFLNGNDDFFIERSKDVENLFQLGFKLI
jgi:hypothetical protein